jgi:hypothetical protein
MFVSARLRRWLTGPESDPSVRARFWAEVEGASVTDRRVRSARSQIGKTGWAAWLLADQLPDGRWHTRGNSGPELFRPRYVATFWPFLILSELGMTASDPRIRVTAKLIFRRFDQRRSGEPQLDYRPRGGNREVCVTGMAVRALLRFGYADHPAVQRSIDWLVQAQLGDGGWNDGSARRGSLDAWKPLAALAEIPYDRRSDDVRRSIERGAEFFLRHHLMREGPRRYPPWFRIHFPQHFYYDVLLGLRLLVQLGYGADPRLRPAVRWLRRKRAADGTWSLDASHPDVDPSGAWDRFEGFEYPIVLEPPGVPSRWATVEALSVMGQLDPT